MFLFCLDCGVWLVPARTATVFVHVFGNAPVNGQVTFGPDAHPLATNAVAVLAK